MTTHPLQLRKSQATSRVITDLGHPLTLDQFKLIIIGFALQNQIDPEMDLGDHLRWLLAYWRADHNDDNRFDRAEVYFYGRVGYCEIQDDEEILETIISAVSLDWDGGATIPLSDAFDFVDWAFNKYVEWAPEPVKVYRTGPQFQILIAQTAILLAQFVDHFEQEEVEYLMMWLLQNYGPNHVVWDLFDHPDKNIEVEVNDQSDRILLLTVPNSGWLKIYWPSTPGVISVTWELPKVKP